MSNNSWKQYGGKSKIDSLNNISVGTIIADQFLSRSTKPTYQYYNGTIGATLDFKANQNLIAGNSIYVGFDSYVNGNSYINNQLFFGVDVSITGVLAASTLPTDTSYAYMFGNFTNIGINTTSPKTSFNITGHHPSITNILTVESGNVYLRNIIAQNVNQRGLVVDANDTNTNILFYNDISTNVSNASNANISYLSGGKLSLNTTNLITSSARSFLFNNSGGQLYFDATKTQWDSSGWFLFNTSGGIQIDTSGGRMKLDNNYYLDVSSNVHIKNNNNSLKFDNNSILLNSSAGLININSGLTKLGNVFLTGNNTQFTSFFTVTPPTGRGVSGEMFNETMMIFDNSNQTYLYDSYTNNTTRSGNALTMVAVDNSSNTFMRAVAPNNMGMAINGGVFPNDSTRSMTNIGLSDICGEFIPAEMIVSGKNKNKYVSTVGINTYSPRTENYVMDVNGPLHLGNGEINTMFHAKFNIAQVQFSKSVPSYGIAVGTSTKISDISYQFFALITTNYGVTWKPSNIDPDNSGNLNTRPYTSSSTLKVGVDDNNFSIIGTDNSLLYYTTNGGVTWTQINYTDADSSNRQTTSIDIVKTDLSYNAIISYTNLANNSNTNFIFKYTFNNLLNIKDANGITDSNGNKFTNLSNPNFIVNSSSVSSNYIYYAGSNNIIKYDFNANTIITQTNSSSRNYNYIFAYSDIYAIAIAQQTDNNDNIIYYTTNGSSWSNAFNTPYNLKSVYIYDPSNAIAIGYNNANNNGAFIYTTNGPDSWQTDTTNVLNSSGIAKQITGSNNYLNNIYMQDKDTFIITTSTSTGTTSPSKILYCYFPNLLNRVNNRVLDVSGNMFISGDININEGGKISTNNSVFNLLNDTNTVNTLNMVSDISNINIGKFATQTVLNGNLKVTNNTNMVLDVSMNSRLFVGGDVSLNRNAYINGNITLPTSSHIFTDNIDTTFGSKLFSGVDNTVNRGILNIGRYSSVTNIGYFDNNNNNANSNANNNFVSNKSVINIGANNPSTDGNTVTINIGNYNTSSDLSNTINIGNGNDYVTITGGNVILATNQPLRVNNPNLILNSNSTQTGSSGGSGIYIHDNNNDKSGYIAVSLDMSGYVFRPTNPKSNIVKLDVNSMTLKTGINFDISYGIDFMNNGIVTLSRTIGQVDSSYTLSVAQIDISNILIRDSSNSNNITQTINTGLNIHNDVSMGNRLFVLHDACFNGNVTINGDLNINKSITNIFTTNYTQLYINEDLSLNGNIFVYGDTSLNQRLWLKLDASMNSRLFVGGDVSFGGNLFVKGDVSMNSRLFVRSDVSMNSRLFVGGDVSFGSNLFVKGDVSFNSRLFLNLDASMNSRLFVGGDVSLNSLLFVKGDVSLNSRLFVGGDVSLNSRLYVGGDVSLNSRLFLSGDASFGGNLYVSKNVGFGLSGSIYNFDVSGTISLKGTVNPITLMDNSVLLSNTYPLDFSANLGNYWTKIYDLSSQNWTGVTMSTTGQYQLAIYQKSNPFGTIYMSNDYGVNWRNIIPTTLTTNLICYMAISGNGQYITYGLPGNSSIYVSSNYGNTPPNPITTTSAIQFSGISISESGEYQSACANSGNIWISNNYGTNWNSKTTTNLAWSSISVCSTGQYQSACVNSGNIWTSNNYGNIWISRASSLAWSSISISATGQYQSACVNPGNIWTSNNYGTTWNSQTTTNLTWSSISISANGQNQVASTTLGNVWISNNYGNTWTQQVTSPSNNISGVKISANSQYLLYCINGGSAFKSITPYPNMFINNGLYVNGDVSLNSRLLVGGDVSLNSR